ncbi:MAG: ABC transporter ATP-binding protein/permease [Bacteroidales bacterium]|jgi:ATP-binding cassette subfamily B protein|nr:ABC transporter ATP-binding protein/permease [Bacteroidales bacterium]
MVKEHKQKKLRESKGTILRLISYLSKEKKLLLAVFLLIIVSTATNIGGSYLLRPIINDYIIPQDVSGLLRMLIILGCIYILGLLTVFFQNILLNRIGERTVARLRYELFVKMESLPIKFFDKNKHGELMSRFTNDIDRVSEVLTETLSSVFSNALSLICILVLMIYISPILTVVTILMIPVMLLAARMIVTRSKKYFKWQQKALGAENAYVEENIGGLKVVKVFNHEERSEEDFDKLNEDLREKARKAQLYSGIMMPMMHNLNTLNFVLITIVGAFLAFTRGLDLGGLATFLQYSRQFGRPINELSNQYNTLQAAIAGAERIFNVIDEKPENELDLIKNNDNPVNLKGDVVFENVFFSYIENHEVLKDINIQASPGKKIALVGSTGAGKTTIFNIIPRFYDPQKGEILFDGISHEKINREDIRKSLAVVLQDTHLFTGTVMENIRYGKLDATDDEVIDAAKLAAAHSFIKRLPDGYNTVLTNDGSNLSQGQRQLLNIARAAIANRPILLLDEATSDVDTRTEVLIQKGIDKLMVGRTSFVIAHRLSTVKNADEILVIEKGRIVERGSHTELMNLKGRYYELAHVNI